MDYEAMKAQGPFAVNVPLVDGAGGAAWPLDRPRRNPAQATARRNALEPTRQRLAAALREHVTDYTWHIWLAPLSIEDAIAGKLFVGAPDHVRSWVRDRYRPLIETVATRLAGHEIAVELVPQTAPPSPAVAPTMRGHAA